MYLINSLISDVNLVVKQTADPKDLKHEKSCLYMFVCNPHMPNHFEEICKSAIHAY